MREGVAPPAVGVQGYHPEKFLKTKNFSTVVANLLRPRLLEPKNNQMEIMKQYLLRNFLLFENYGQ